MEALRKPWKTPRRRRNCTDGSVLFTRLPMVKFLSFPLTQTQTRHWLRLLAAPARVICRPTIQRSLDRHLAEREQSIIFLRRNASVNFWKVAHGVGRAVPGEPPHHHSLRFALFGSAGRLAPPYASTCTKWSSYTSKRGFLREQNALGPWPSARNGGITRYKCCHVNERCRHVN